MQLRGWNGPLHIIVRQLELLPRASDADQLLPARLRYELSKL